DVIRTRAGGQSAARHYAGGGAGRIRRIDALDVHGHHVRGEIIDQRRGGAVGRPGDSQLDGGQDVRISSQIAEVDVLLHSQVLRDGVDGILQRIVEVRDLAE